MKKVIKRDYVLDEEIIVIPPHIRCFISKICLLHSKGNRGKSFRFSFGNY